MNIVWEDREFRDLVRSRFQVLNDGAGLAWAARRMGRPFPDNLNGTDLVPALLEEVPEGTTVYLLGTRPEVVAEAYRRMTESFPRARFVGYHHGFLDDESEAEVARELTTLQPRIVLVGMGNPLQVRFIDRHRALPGLDRTIWLAVGGLLDYHSGVIRRAPRWARSLRLEWLYIVTHQPHKARRYFGGIPRFLTRCMQAESAGSHDVPPSVPPIQGMLGPGFEEQPATGKTPGIPARARFKARLRDQAARFGRSGRLADPDAPRVLCYHGVDPDPPDEWTVTPTRLRNHMRILASDRHPVSIQAILDWLEGRIELPPRAVAVTFDDGFLDVLRWAAPILADAGVPGTVFVCSGLAESGASAASRDFRVGRPLLDWAGVLRLRDAGWTIGSHGITHGILSRMPDDVASQELARSREAISRRIDAPVDVLAYPFGTPGKVSKRTHVLASEAGYRAAFMAVTGGLSRDMDRFSIPRSKVLGTDSFRSFEAIISGRLDSWARIERRG